MSEAREAEGAAALVRAHRRTPGLRRGTALPPKVSVPTLVLGTPDDAIVPHHHQRATAEAITGAAFAPLPDGGHFYPQTRQAAFLERLQPFLRG